MYKLKLIIFCLFTLCLMQLKTSAQIVNSSPDQYQKGNLIYKDDFETDLKAWIAEFPPSQNSSVSIKDGKLVIDVLGGATVWLNKKLSGNLSIEYKRKVILDKGPNDRLSDLNQFWMATDPVPLPGPHPYWGQALGATYYNWGFFGAQRHAQYISHSGYYDNYYQFGYTKGY